ncbi:hypothetical protein ACFWVC_01355 [Streptomyces sp. NPDC058691]|uniref:hypothetical protein n=1 Tax=Streptomyces sp. NPDC058691 TaxID=3346601 RepID=UPI003653442C
MSDKYDPPEPIELLSAAVAGYCDLETGECVTSPLPADDKSVIPDPPTVAEREAVHLDRQRRRDPRQGPTRPDQREENRQ